MRHAYVGIAESHSVIVFPLAVLDPGLMIGAADAYALRARIDVSAHYPTVFAWGDDSAGSSQLALAILADYLGDYRAAELMHAPFRVKVIEGLDRDKNFVLLPADIQPAIDAIREAIYGGRNA